MYTASSNIRIALDPTIVQQCVEAENQHSTSNNSQDDINAHPDDIMNTMEIIKQYYGIHNDALGDTLSEAEIHRVYVQAKQIIVYFSLPNMRYHEYLDWVFQKLKISDKPNDPLYKVMQQYLNGQAISFKQLFETMLVEDMNYLGD